MTTTLTEAHGRPRLSQLRSRNQNQSRRDQNPSKHPQSPIAKFMHDNRTHVLRPESGNAPNCYYVGIDKEVS